MAVSVTTRPSQWSAVKNPVVYTFTSTGHGALVNYRIEVEVFKASDDTSLTGGVKFSFTPDADGISYADISTIVKAYLKPEWVFPGSVVSAVEDDSSIKVYIKYQELYDGSATSVVDDVANQIICVYAAMQIGSTPDMDAYVLDEDTKKLLILFDEPKLWRGYEFTYSILLPASAYDGILREVTQYYVDGAEAAQSYNNITLNTDKVNRFTLFNPSLPLLVDEVTHTDVKYLAVNLLASSGTGASGDIIQVANIGETISAPAPYKFYLVVHMETAGAAQNMRIEINVNDGVLVYATLKDTGTSLVTSVDVNETTDYITPTNPFDRFHVKFYSDAGTYDWSYTVGVYIPISETKRIYVADPCNNPVLLFWKNSLGGDSFWLFEHGQEMGYSYSGRKKAKRMTLFAEHLTLNQWEALNELNTIGEIYAENIQEFTSSVNKSHVRDGAQVYVVDTDGSKTGVIVIPSNSVINTKDEVHSISIEIEFPERVE